MWDKRKGKRILSLMLGISVGVFGCQRAEAATPVYAAAVQSNEQAEIERGREILGQACIQCHNLRALQIQRKSAEKWKDTVYSMISRGAQILPEEIGPLTAYLVMNFGPNSPPPSLPTQTSGGTRSASGPLEQPPAEAEGKSIFLRSCQECHGLESVTRNIGSQADWSEIIKRMVSYGAKLTQTEERKLIEYLSGLTQPR